VQRRVLIVFGTRPEGIKMMPVVKALRNEKTLDTVVAVTGQHREMLGQVFTAFGERPDVDLDLMVSAQTLPQITTNVLNGISRLVPEIGPDLMLVHGDTTTALAAAMAGFYCRIPIGHVEAGLRSFDLTRPWPEEYNRVSIDSISTLMFAPTEAARANLLNEYNRNGRIFVTGNTGIDSLLFFSSKVETDRASICEMTGRYSYLDPQRTLILVTGHRRESFGQGFEDICEGIRRIAERGDAQVIYPVHLNPNVRDVVLLRLGGLHNVHLIEPVEYLDMVFLMKRAKIIITDSGGIQEEAPALGRPVLVMRDVTERPEALATGVVKLIGTDPHLMRSEVDLLLDCPSAYQARARPVFPYGNGTAAAQIASIIRTELTAGNVHA
jgi:UDP-N-acetylglucosamine 2-epimerase (non-hydrolysing)